MIDCTFPCKRAWKSIVKRAVGIEQNGKYQNGVSSKEDSQRLLRVHPSLKPMPLYAVTKRNVSKKIQLCNIVKFLAIPVNQVELNCDLCDACFYDLVKHMFLQCQKLKQFTEKLWDRLINEIDVRYSVILFQMEDVNALDVLLGHPWELSEENHAEYEKCMCIVADELQRMIRNLTQ
jgi:hypothetical protein